MLPCGYQGERKRSSECLKECCYFLTACAVLLLLFTWSAVTLGRNSDHMVHLGKHAKSRSGSEVGHRVTDASELPAVDYCCLHHHRVTEQNVFALNPAIDCMNQNLWFGVIPPLIDSLA